MKEKIKKFFVNILKWFWANILAIVAVTIAILSFRATSKQFEITSRDSQKQFETNITQSRELFDSLMTQFDSSNAITSKQLKIVNELLGVTKQTLDERIRESRPILSVLKTSIDSIKHTSEGLFAPEIITIIQNTGIRSAYNTKSKQIAFTKNLKTIRFSNDSTLNPISKNMTKIISFLPKLQMDESDEFYFYLELSFYDAILEEEFQQKYFYKHYKSRGKEDFYDCPSEELSFMKDIIKIAPN